MLELRMQSITAPKLNHRQPLPATEVEDRLLVTICQNPASVNSSFDP